MKTLIWKDFFLLVALISYFNYIYALVLTAGGLDSSLSKKFPEYFCPPFPETSSKTWYILGRMHSAFALYSHSILIFSLSICKWESRWQRWKTREGWCCSKKCDEYSSQWEPSRRQKWTQISRAAFLICSGRNVELHRFPPSCICINWE